MVLRAARACVWFQCRSLGAALQCSYYTYKLKFGLHRLRKQNKFASIRSNINLKFLCFKRKHRENSKKLCDNFKTSTF